MRLALLLLALAGCAGPALSLPPMPDAVGGPIRDVWVVRHGWHTGVALRRADVDPASWPESRDPGEGAYIEVGWGDRDFYPKGRPSLWDAIDPVVRATPAVLQVGVFDQPPPTSLPEAVVRLAVTAAGLDRLTRFVHAHYVHDAAGRPVRLQPGYYPRAWFYLAGGRYHALIYNSNHWTATALRDAGVPIDPASATTAGAVMRQAAEIAARREGAGPR